MRDVNPAAQAVREARNGMFEVPMVWITAKDFATAAPESIGLWAGADTEAITVEDLFAGAVVTRSFQGRGAMLAMSAIRFESGLNIRPVTITLSSIDEAVRLAARGYDTRGAQVQIWRRAYNPATMLPVSGLPERVFKGYVNGSPIERPAPGGEGTVELRCVSSVRLLTLTSDAKKSHEAQKRRNGDEFRKYKATAGEINPPWGMEGRS